MLLEFEMPVNGLSRTSSTSSTNSWNLSFSCWRSFSIAGGGLGSLVMFWALTDDWLVIWRTLLFDALLVWSTAKNRKLSETNAQANIDAQRRTAAITSGWPPFAARRARPVAA